jgi:hypothetical protein
MRFLDFGGAAEDFSAVTPLGLVNLAGHRRD